MTDKGYAYAQDGQLEEISINIKEVVNYLDKKKPTFQTLWDLIGKESDAPFYVTGPEFFNVVKEFVRLDAISYSEYIKLRQQKGYSTSRVSWYNDLFKNIKPEKMDLFFDSLSVVIRNVYNHECMEKKDDGKIGEDYEPRSMEELGHPSDTSCIAASKQTVFISYSHDTPQHEEWVNALADHIRAKEINVITDKDIRFGQDTNHFMEESIANSNRVLVVVTSRYKTKADGRMNGVGYETGIITSELVNDQNSIKFVPIIREGSGNEFYPRYLSNRWGADFSDDAKYREMLDKLITDIQKKS